MLEFEKVLMKADNLFLHEYRLQETLDLLKTLDHSNVQVLYRLARSCYQLSKHAPKRSIKIELIKNGFQYAENAIKIDNESSEAHAWYAVLLDAVSELHGLKERAVRLKDVKRHMLRAKELNPKEAVPCYIYGIFCYEIAGLAWYEKMILESLFTKPPEGSYEEALQNFLQAEINEPDFYSVNKLMTAKCYIALRNYSQAEIYLKRALNVRIKNDDDAECIEEAKKLLPKIKNFI